MWCVGKDVCTHVVNRRNEHWIRVKPVDRMDIQQLHMLKVPFLQTAHVLKLVYHMDFKFR